MALSVTANKVRVTTTIRTVAYIVGSAMALGAVLYGVRACGIAANCFTDNVSESQSGFGRKAVISETFCDAGLVHGDELFVILLGKHWFNRDVVIFRFTPDGSDRPQVTWESAASLVIAVKSVDHIIEQRSVVDGISVRYQIVRRGRP